MKDIPEVGKYYHFWDDGKFSQKRHYICKVERLISANDSSNIVVDIPSYDYNYDPPKSTTNSISLYDWWKQQVSLYYWLYAKETEYFVELSCPKYDKHLLYAVRTTHGNWFTMNIQSSWQSGELDVDSKHYNDLLNSYINNKYVENKDEFIKQYPLATKENC